MTLTLGAWGMWAGIIALETTLLILIAVGGGQFISDARRKRACWWSS